MRGFNLFAAFLGVAMIAIAVGYSMYAQQAKTQRMDNIMLELVRFDTAGVSAVIKSDVYNTILMKIRNEFQDYFANTVLNPPQYVWNSESAFIAWFENEFAQSDATTYWVADRMMAELQAYTSVPVLGEEYEISVVGSVDSTAEALKDATYAKILPDGTFVYVIDTTKMSPEAYSKLPRIMVRKRGEVSGATTDIVLPRGKWEIPVRLRILEAYRVAKRARDYLHTSGKYKDLALAVGHCDAKNISVCDIFRVDGTKIEPLTRDPSKFADLRVASGEMGDVKGSIIAPCTYQNMDYIRFLEKTGMSWEEFKDAMKKILQEQLESLQKMRESAMSDAELNAIDERIQETQNALNDLDSDAARDELKEGPCRGDYDILLPILNAISVSETWDVIGKGGITNLRDPETGDKLVDGITNFTITPDGSTYEKYETARIIRRTAINPAEIVCNEVAGIPDLVLKLLGMEGICENVAEATANTAAVISFDACQISGSAYCVAPTEYAYIVTWSDPNERYRIDPDVPATFHLRVSEGKIPYAETLKVLESTAQSLTVGSEEQKDLENEYATEILANAQQYLPQIIESCLKQYTSVETKCRSSLSDENVTYILTGYYPQELETCGDSCQPKDNMEGMCKRMSKFGDAVSVPGVYTDRSTADWAKIVAGFEEMVYCDKYIAAGGYIEKITNKLREIGTEMYNMTKTAICPKHYRPGDMSLSDVAKMGLFGPYCMAQDAAAARDALATIYEYNNIYWKYITGEVAGAQQSGTLGTCSVADTPELNAFIQAFAEPRVQQVGDQTFSMGGNCHPDHVFDQALQIAKMRAESIKCDINPPTAKSAVLVETTWMHIGSEIYASCDRMG